MAGVKFTEAAARRIVEATRRVESAPGQRDQSLPARKFTGRTGFWARIDTNDGEATYTVTRMTGDGAGALTEQQIDDADITYSNVHEVNGLWVAVGSIVWVWLNEVIDAEGETVAHYQFSRGGDPEFPAKITDNTAYSGFDFRWQYAWTELVCQGTSFAVLEGGRSGTTSENFAMNVAELGHTMDIAWGVDISAADYPAGFAPRPVGASGDSDDHDYDVIVWMKEFAIESSLYYWFDRNGSHDGTCTA